jgi:transcription initiation factor TFIIIB Brf1 subunit/transcription initiation factor TFIIB
MIRHPFEGGEPHRESRPMPCPECQSTKGYSRVGNYRVQCLDCNTLLRNEEVDMQIVSKE